MRKKIQMTLAVAGLFSGLAITSAFAQTSDDKKMSDDKMSGEQMSGKKMSHQEMMDKMNKMSVDDKAAMFDKMSEKDKMSAMKMGGHDMGKMSHGEMMDMGKMSTQDKADMFDKMPMEKKMSMMKGGSMMHKGKKMDKGTMDKQ